jgi:LPXTG-site transpeptidase (sortase) family protein
MFSFRQLAAATLLLAASYARAAETPSAFPLLQSQGAVSGYQDGTLRLQNPMTRAEAVKVLVASDANMRNEVSAARKSDIPLPYTDVASGSWYSPYIAVATQRGFVTGFPDGTMRPGRPTTVAEAAVMIERFARIKRDVRFRTSSFLPNTPRLWFTEAVSAVIARNLLSEPLSISAPILRGQFFTMLERLRTAERSASYAYIPAIKTSTLGLSARLLPSFKIRPSELTPPQFASTKSFALTIPDLDIADVTVVHPPGVTTQDALLKSLSDGVGHLFSYPGEGGKILIYGHSANWPWVRNEYARLFEDLDELEKNDKLYITYNGTLYTYEVLFGRIVAADDVSPFSTDQSGEVLILYTCWPPGTTDARYIVSSRLVEKAGLL